MSNRVVITGLGIISPYGLGTTVMWENLIEGKDCFKPIQIAGPEDHISFIGGCLDDFDPATHISNRKMIKLMNREAQMACLAAQLAIKDADINIADLPVERLGLYLGTGLTSGELDELVPIVEKSLVNGKIDLQRFGTIALPECNPLLSFKILTNMPVCYISILLGIKGPNLVFNAWSGQVGQSIGEAFRDIRCGKLDYALTGGVDSKTNPVGLMTLSSLGITNQQVKTSSPFGEDRCGAVISEGGAFLVLENMELALARKAHIYAELAGCGQATDCYSIKLYSQFVSPLKKCMQEAIKDAGIASREIDYINASANSHPIGDLIEAEAINEVFENNRPMVSSTKTMTGDLVAGSASFELALTALFLKEQIVPPTINKTKIDKKSNLNFTAEKAQHKRLNVVMSNNFEMGNIKVSFILKSLSKLGR